MGKCILRLTFNSQEGVFGNITTILYLKVEDIVCMLSNWNFGHIAESNVELKASLVPQGDQQFNKPICREQDQDRSQNLAKGT